MPASLVTISTFYTPTEANIAKNYLEEQGFHPFLSEEEAVGMLWQLGGAFGGIKLQVPQDQAEQAFRALEHVPDHPEAEDHITTEPPPEPAEAEEPEPIVVSEGEQMAARAFRAAVIGWFLFPPLVSIYSMWVLFRLASWPGDLSTAGTLKATCAYILNGVVLVFAYIFITTYLKSL